MSHANRNFVIVYVFLVLLPLAALAGILRAGRNVKAPISVDGAWNLTIDSTQLNSLPCGKDLAAESERTILLSQSGKGFLLTFANGPRVSANGTLDGTTLRASLTPSREWSAEAGCGAGRQLSLQATVNPSSQPKSMRGSLSVEDCSSCVPVEFQAVQQAAPTRKEGH
jgi:hypothetical protein